MNLKLLLLLAPMLFSSVGFTQNLNVESIYEKDQLPSSSKPKSHASEKSLTAIWGAGAITGVADGEFQTAITASNAGLPYPATGWTARSISQSGGSVTPGSAFWTNSVTGTTQGAYGTTSTPIASPSQANGSAIFDSDFLDNNGVPGAFGTGSSPSPHRGELISPRIDLTGYTDSALTIQFFL